MELLPQIIKARCPFSIDYITEGTDKTMNLRLSHYQILFKQIVINDIYFFGARLVHKWLFVHVTSFQINFVSYEKKPGRKKNVRMQINAMLLD